MNSVVKVSQPDGSFDIVEMTPSSFSEFASEFYNGLDRNGRKLFHQELLERKTFNFSDGRTFVVLK